MMNNMKILCLQGCALLFSLHISAQQSFNAGGGDAVGPAGSVSYTVGQVDFTHHETQAGRLNLGVQQPFETLKLPVNQFIPCLIYPNPATNAVNLSVTDPNFLTFSFVLYDPMGKVHRSETGLAVTDSVLLDGLADGVYFISIKNNLNQVWNCHLIKVSP